MRPALLAAAGAVVGSSARWGIGELLACDGFPWATLIVNLVGCALAGFAARHLLPGSDRWLAVMTGLLGGLTTFSAFATETRALVDDGHPGRALLYVAVSVVGGLAAVEIARGDWRRR